MSEAAVDDILEILTEQGQQRYGNEAVSQLQHALQTATLALQSDAPQSLIAAALLHDFGHLVHSLGEDAADQGLDDRHEYRALDWLKPCFGAAVTEPIRLHVEAKRYLCFTDSIYWQQLSPASQRSLTLQGGPFNLEMAKTFIQQPYASEAVCLRQWDDLAKVPQAVTPPLSKFRDILLAACLNYGPE